MEESQNRMPSHVSYCPNSTDVTLVCSDDKCYNAHNFRTFATDAR